MRIDEARQELRARSLPIHDLDDFDDLELPDTDPDAAAFVACLRAVNMSARLIQISIDDYRRAFAHRSRWARRLLVGPHEFVRYDERLLRQWTIRADRMLRDIGGDVEPAGKAAAGHGLWDDLSAAVHEPLRPEVRDAFIQAGSLHLLADDDELAWHPDDVDRIFKREPAEDAA